MKISLWWSRNKARKKKEILFLWTSGKDVEHEMLKIIKNERDEQANKQQQQ